tara:strand:+ start:439 stop:696 length:258 start_codon:yes stop_codon:yes gene_type:complete
MTLFVIGICLLLLVIVVFIAAKPISMGIEARRNINNKTDIDEDQIHEAESENMNISDEIIKLKKLKDDGIISDDEYIKAKNKLLD